MAERKKKTYSFTLDDETPVMLGKLAAKASLAEGGRRVSPSMIIGRLTAKEARAKGVE